MSNKLTKSKCLRKWKNTCIVLVFILFSIEIQSAHLFAKTLRAKLNSKRGTKPIHETTNGLINIRTFYSVCQGWRKIRCCNAIIHHSSPLASFKELNITFWFLSESTVQKIFWRVAIKLVSSIDFIKALGVPYRVGGRNGSGIKWYQSSLIWRRWNAGGGKCGKDICEWERDNKYVELHVFMPAYSLERREEEINK